VQPVAVEVEPEFDAGDPIRPRMEWALAGQVCIRCGLDLTRIDGWYAQCQAMAEPRMAPLPPTDGEAVQVLVDRLGMVTDLSTIREADVAWCLQRVLQVADSALDETDPPHLRLAAETIQRLAAEAIAAD